MKSRKILLLSVSAGAGHLRAAEAIRVHAMAQPARPDGDGQRHGRDQAAALVLHGGAPI